MHLDFGGFGALARIMKMGVLPGITRYCQLTYRVLGYLSTQTFRRLTVMYYYYRAIPDLDIYYSGLLLV